MPLKIRKIFFEKIFFIMQPVTGNRLPVSGNRLLHENDD